MDDELEKLQSRYDELSHELADVRRELKDVEEQRDKLHSFLDSLLDDIKRVI